MKLQSSIALTAMLVAALLSNAQAASTTSLDATRAQVLLAQPAPVTSANTIASMLGEEPTTNTPAQQATPPRQEAKASLVCNIFVWAISWGTATDFNYRGCGV